ncbi:putative salutaridine reductase (NADPH) [Helianthus annuus]|nr:putative salutaridine reductase (NADPH) [Helianthus annuus]
MFLFLLIYDSKTHHLEFTNNVKSFVYWFRIAVVTGGKRGIGFEICKQLVSSARDLLVVITAKDEQKGLQSLDKLKTLSRQYRIICRFIKTKFGKLDILVLIRC